MMKKITALLLCFLLLCGCSVVAFAAVPEEETTDAVISTTVPDTHTITIVAPDAKVFYEGTRGVEFVVGRLSEPRLLIRAESGKTIKKVTVNDVDVTAELYGGYLDFAPVYEDKLIVVTTENEPAVSPETYTVVGRITLNGQPLTGVHLELRSTLMTALSGKEGTFLFENVEQGEHSLTALKDGKVIGYISFILEKDYKTDVSLLENGTYIVSVDQSGAGVELHMALHEETGMLTIWDVAGISRHFAPDTGDNTPVWLWGLLVLTSVVCAAVLGVYRRKKMHKNA